MFSGLDRGRVEYLFSVGAGSILVKTFLDENRSRLISLGAQYFKRSKGSAQDLQFLLSLPGKSESVVKSWFLSKIDDKDLLAPEALVAQFQAVEDGTAEMALSQKKAFAAQGLAYLLQTPVPKKWLLFLQRPIQKETEPTESAPSNPELQLSPNEIAQAITGASEEPAALQLAAFIDALVAVKTGKPGRAEKVLAKITNDSMRATLSAAISADPPEMRVTGSNAADPIELEAIEEIDVEAIQILARPSGRTRPGQPAFLNVLGIYMKGQVYTTTAENMKEMLDGQNAVIAFPNTKSVRLPADQELGAWYVEKYATPHAIKFRVVKPGNAILTVVDLPFASSNHDAVRIALQQAPLDPWVRPIFRLTDEAVVRLPDEAIEPKKYNFQEPLELWHRLRIWNIDGKQIVISPLPPVDELYDCADITSVIKRLIQQSSAARQLPSLSHAQVQAFVQALRTDPVDLTEARLRRVEHNFATFIDSREQLLSIVPSLLSTPEIKSIMELEKTNWRSTFESENVKLRTERDRLQNEIVELSAKHAILSEENRKASRDTKLVVRKAFDKAKQAGITSLGDIAVFSALMRERNDRSAVDDSRNSLVVRKFPCSGSIRERLCEIGIPIIEALGMEQFINAGAKLGFLILFTGPMSGQLAAAAAKGISKNSYSVADVPIGLTDSSGINEAIDSIEDSDVVLLRSCNLSPYEAYGASISDLAVTRLSNKHLTSELGKPIFILSTIEGVVALPISEELRTVSVTLDSRKREVSASDFVSFADGSAFPDNRLKSLAFERMVDELRSGDPAARETALRYAYAQLLY